MRKGPFLPKQFTATQWSTEDDKAEFVNTLLHFIDSGFKLTLFMKKLYSRLSNMFGHIAHYTRGLLGGVVRRSLRSGSLRRCRVYLRARGGSARKAGSEYRRPPASSNDVEERDRRPSHEMSSPIPVPTVPVQGTLF